jgi:thiol-disulfide isomerase/thioredoxin
MMDKKNMKNNRIFLTIVFGLLSLFYLSSCNRFGQNGTTPPTITSMSVATSETIPATLETKISPTIEDKAPTRTIEVGYAPPGAGGQTILTPASSYPSVPATPTDTNANLGQGQLSPYPAADELRLTITPQSDAPYPLRSPVPGTSTALTSNEIYYATATALAYPAPALSDPQAFVTQPIMISTNSPTPFPGITPTLVRTRFTPTNPKFFTLVAGSPQLIVLYADWSPESNSIAPVINGLESRYSGQVNFVYLDLEDPANSLLKVLAEPRVPPIIFLLDGQGNILNYWRGLVEPLELEQALQLAIR